MKGFQCSAENCVGLSNKFTTERTEFFPFYSLSELCLSVVKTLRGEKVFVCFSVI